MKLKKSVIFVALTLSPLAHNAYAYNDDLFNENSVQIIVDKSSNNNNNSTSNTPPVINQVIIIDQKAEQKKPVSTNNAIVIDQKVEQQKRPVIIKETAPKEVYNENLFDNIEIKGKPSSAQLNALESLTIDSKPVVKVEPVKIEPVNIAPKIEPKIEKTTSKDSKSESKKTQTTSGKDDGFKVVKEKIEIPPDHSKNPIKLVEIEDTATPEILGHAGPIASWQPVDTKAVLTKPSAPRVKPVEQADPTTDKSVDEFYGINKDLLTNDNNSKNKSVEKSVVSTAIPLPGSLPVSASDTKDKKSATKDTAKTKSEDSVKKVTTVTTPVVPAVVPEKKPTNGFLNPQKTDTKVEMKVKPVTPVKPVNTTPSVYPNVPLPSGNLFGQPKAVSPTTTIKTSATSISQNRSESNVQITANPSSINIPVIPIPGTLGTTEVTPKAIRGNKISTANLGKDVYIRIFKQEHSLELWLKQGERYQLANTYDICRYSGGLGPKKNMGDRKSPEGFYQVTKNNLQPNSSYYKAINIGFPNAYDKSHGYTGNYLMIHGDCVSVGCYAMTNNYIKEIYKYVEAAFNNGQNKININIYPFKMTDKNLNRYKGDSNYAFWQQLQPGYKYFEVTKTPPSVEVSNGKYLVQLPKGFRDPDNEPMFAKN